MIKGLLLIAVVLSFLLWISTFGDNEIRTKMEFYGSSTGQFVTIALFILPLVFVVKWVLGRKSGDKKSLCLVIASLVSVQLVIGAFAPNIVSMYQQAGAVTAEFVIDSKNR